MNIYEYIVCLTLPQHHVLIKMTGDILLHKIVSQEPFT